MKHYFSAMYDGYLDLTIDMIRMGVPRLFIHNNAMHKHNPKHCENNDVILFEALITLVQI